MRLAFAAIVLALVGGMNFAGSASAIGVGTGTLTWTGCSVPEAAVAFVIESNGAGTSHTFTIVDVGPTACAWANGEQLVGTGSLATGLTGQVVSGPWVITGGSFTVASLRFNFVGPLGGYSILGSASGSFA